MDMPAMPSGFKNLSCFFLIPYCVQQLLCTVTTFHYMGDFRSSQAYLNSLGGTKASTAVNYTYDVKGDFTRDMNKDIDTAGASGTTVHDTQFCQCNWK